MQGQRSAIDSFSCTVDLNQGSASNNNNMDQPTAWDNMLNPVEGRLSNYGLASGEGNFSFVNVVGQNGQNFNGRELGESSSRGNVQDQVSSDELRMEHASSLSFDTFFHPFTGVEERQIENLSNGLDGNQVIGGPMTLESSSSNRIPLGVNLNTGHAGNTDASGQGMRAGACPNLYESGRSEKEQIASVRASSDDAGTSGYMMEDDGESSSSLGSWSPSCKRKALEGTSRQSHAGGSSSFCAKVENVSRQTVAPRLIGGSSSSLSSNPVTTGVHAEVLNPRVGVSVRGVTSEVFPLSDAARLAERRPRNFGMRMNLESQESVALNVQPTGHAIRRTSVCSSHQSSRPLSFSNSLDHRPPTAVSTNSSNPTNRSNLGHLPVLPRNLLPFSLGGSAGSSSNLLVLSEDQSAVHQDDAFRNTVRSHTDQPMFLPGTEPRNLVQDTTSWSLATGNSSTSGGVNYNSRVGSTSGARSFPDSWTPHHNPPVQNQRRLPEFTPWNLFPSIESDARGERGHFSLFPSGPASSEDTSMSSSINIHGRRQPNPTSSTMLMDLPADNGWRALAADIEGRQRLVTEIRQVLNAMRRGENLRAEDYMLFDPFINGMAELQDRHRDMRLDVDNMSYEELLALEERIGDVNTGLSEGTVLETMKQHKHLAINVGSPPPNLEPCCICQEEYATGDDVGTLDCGHDFHTNCIKQWLRQKNLCPVCKMTALITRSH